MGPLILASEHVSGSLNLSVRALQVDEIPIGEGLEIKLKSLRECLYLRKRGWEKRKETKTVLDI